MIFAALSSLLAVQQGPFWDRMSQANEAATLCSVRAAVRLDDRQTSPDLLARAGMAACFSEFNALDTAIDENTDNELPTVPFAQRRQAADEFKAKLRRRVEDLTIQGVLEIRRRNHAQNR